MANDLNTVAIIGRLTKDCTLNTFQNGSGVLNFTIAVNKSQKQGNEWKEYTSFFEITYFSKGAEKLSAYLVKGKQVSVSGYLKQERWEKDGKKNSAIKIMADNVQLFGDRSADNKGSEGNFKEQSENFSDDEFPEDVPF